MLRFVRNFLIGHLRLAFELVMLPIKLFFAWTDKFIESPAIYKWLAITLFLSAVSFALPVIEYRIFQRAEYIRHPYLYMAWVLCFLSIAGLSVVHRAGLFLALPSSIGLIFIGALTWFPSVVVPKTISDYHFAPGFYAITITTILLTLFVTLTFTDANR